MRIIRQFVDQRQDFLGGRLEDPIVEPRTDFEPPGGAKGTTEARCTFRHA